MTKQVPIGVSARHVHLSDEHIEQLFGVGAKLTHDFDLSQPGQFAAKERIKLASKKGEIDGVRVLGPARAASQVEISKTDSVLLGLDPPIRLSGEVQSSERITLIGPRGIVQLQEGVIIARAHIHMHREDSAAFHVVDGELVDVHVLSERPVVFKDVVVRVADTFKLEMHIDTDEGNAANITNGVFGVVVKGGVANE